MPRFFVDSEAILNRQVTITGNDAWHLVQVQRMKTGDVIEVFTNDTAGYSVKLRELHPERVIGEIQKRVVETHESPLAVTLFQGVAKGERMDFVMQKAVELGVAAVVPFFSKHCVVRFDAAKTAKRQQRWQRIVAEAAKQCYRDAVPPVSAPLAFSELEAAIGSGNFDFVMFPYEREKRPLADVSPHKNPKTSAVIIGPEGGFAPEEAARLQELGATSVSLGPRILRTETAGIVALTMLGMLFGDLNREVGTRFEN